MVRFAAADYVVVLVFLIIVLVVGFSAKRAARSLDYIVAGRAVTLPALVATLVATWYGGILGIGEYTYQYGISNWVVLGLPYYIFAILFAYLLAPHIREAATYSLADRLAQSYGRWAAIVGGVLTFILVTPAPYLLMMGLLLSRIFGLNLIACMAIGGAVSTIYLYRGGLGADIRVNIVQFLAMYIGIAVIIPFCIAKYGGLGFLRANLPQGHWTWDGGNGTLYVISWFFIALWTLVDPGFHQRAAAAKDPMVAKKAILWSVLLWFVFDLITTTAGLYSRAILRDEIVSDATNAFPILAERVLTPGFLGLFYVGMAATVMSTLVSYAFLGGVAFGRDIVWRLRAQETEDRLNRYTRVGILVATVAGFIIAYYVRSVVELWFSLGSCIIPGLLLPVVLSFFPRLRPMPKTALAMLFLGSVTSTIWFIWGTLEMAGAYPLGLLPMYPGLLVTLLLYAADRMSAGGRRKAAERLA